MKKSQLLALIASASLMLVACGESGISLSARKRQPLSVKNHHAMQKKHCNDGSSTIVS